MTLTEISNLTVTDKENQGQIKAKKEVKKSVEQEEPLLKENPQRYTNSSFSICLVTSKTLMLNWPNSNTLKEILFRPRKMRRTR